MADEITKKPIEVLFSDESLQDLSEDFKTKAAVIFDNAVSAQISEEKKILEEKYEIKLEEDTVRVEKELEEKVNSYLSYVAEEWMKDNELAIESGIQHEIAESFLKGIKDLFVENYIEIPEEKVDIVAEMTEELDKKGVSLDEAIDVNIELKKEIIEMKKAQIVSGLVGNFADTQKDKLNDLVEMVDYEDEDQFGGRVKSIIETYFKKSLTEDDEKKKDNDDDNEDEDDDDKKKKEDDKKKSTDESMKSYLNAISQSVL